MSGRLYQFCSIPTAAPVRNKDPERSRKAQVKPVKTWLFGGLFRCSLWRRQAAATGRFLPDFRVLNGLKTSWKGITVTQLRTFPRWTCLFLFFAKAEFGLGFYKHQKETETQRNQWLITERMRAWTESPWWTQRAGKVDNKQHNTTQHNTLWLHTNQIARHVR